MPNEHEENLDSLENEAEETENQEEVEEEGDSEELEELKKKVQTLEKQKEHWRSKAEKKPEPKKEVSTEPQIELTPKDSILLMKADVSEDEDIEAVLDYARYKKIPISEALQSNVVKATIEENREKRQTAKATNTNRQPRGGSKVSPDAIVAKARRGEFSDSDSDIERLVEAEMALKKKK